MSLTAAQLTILKTNIAANTTVIDFGGPTAINALPNTGDANFEIAKWYNLIAVPDYFVWFIAPADSVFNAIQWKSFTPLDIVPVSDVGSVFLNRAMVCNLKQMNLQTMIVGRDTVNGKNLLIRNGFKDSLQDLPSGVNGALLDAGWIAVRDSLSRQARNIEKVLVTGGSGTKVSAGDMGYEGIISGQDVTNARNS